ncbi:MAG: hypothetical protein N3F06_01395, partial [Nitrososphaerales archaeon]|nr:hypothetical protein [Nitrososphaerales archaeon]
MLRIEFRGLEEFKLWIQRSPKELRKILIDTIDKASQEAYNISREKVPVRTGYLRSTIFILKPNPYEFVLGAYA